MPRETYTDFYLAKLFMDWLDEPWSDEPGPFGTINNFQFYTSLVTNADVSRGLLGIPSILD